MSFPAKNLLTLSCQVRQTGRNCRGIDGRAGTDNSGCGWSLNENSYPSSTLSTSVWAHCMCSARRALPPSQVGTADSGSRALVLGLLGFTSTATTCFWEEFRLIFPGVCTGNPWMVTLGNGVGKGCSRQVWERTAPSGRENCRISRSLHTELCYTSNDPQRARESLRAAVLK